MPRGPARVFVPISRSTVIVCDRKNAIAASEIASASTRAICAASAAATSGVCSPPCQSIAKPVSGPGTPSPSPSPAPINSRRDKSNAIARLRSAQKSHNPLISLPQRAAKGKPDKSQGWLTMAKAAANNGQNFPWRILGWGGAACLLLVPLAAHFPWTLSDFIVAAVMLGTAGAALELAVRFSRGSLAYRAGAAFAVAAAFLLVWVNGAVGFLGDEGNPANLVFVAVLAIALFGAVLARFRSA